MLYLINFFDFCKYMLILKFMPAACSNNFELGQQKTAKVEECSKTSKWNISQLKRCIGSR